MEESFNIAFDSILMNSDDPDLLPEYKFSFPLLFLLLAPTEDIYIFLREWSFDLGDLLYCYA
jgi:hypothetical protein